MIITGVIRTQSKLHVTSAIDGSTKINSEGRFNTPDATISLSRTYRTPVFSAQAGRIEVPFFPANSLIGKLRRAARDRIMEALSNRKEAISRTSFRGMSCGAADSSPESASLIADEFSAMLKDPFLGLFGGGKRMYESAIKISDILPVIACTIESNQVPESAASMAAINKTAEGTSITNRVTGIDVIHRRDDLMAGLEEEVISTIYDYEDVFTKDMAQEAQRKAQAAATRAKGKNAKLEEGEEKIARASMTQQSAREYICAGVPMYFEAKLQKRATPIQQYLFALALCDVFNVNQFGGVSHLGYGKLNLADVAANMLCTIGKETAPLFSLKTDGQIPELELSHPSLVGVKAEFEKYLAEVSPAQIENFYLASKPEVEKA